MGLHDSAFWSAAFFLLGVFFISFFGNFLVAAIFSLLIFLYFLIFKNYWLAGLSLLVIIGAGYYQTFDYFQSQVKIIFGVKAEFSGIVRKIEQSDTRQELILELGQPYSGRIKINIRPYPSFEYGDRLKISGIIKEPLPETRDYLAKDGIFGTASFPEIAVLEKGQGNFIKSLLLVLKSKIFRIFKENLPQEKAALLAGLTLGERAGFSKEFKEKMNLSGTTHIVALSGYNISVIGWAAAGIFGLWLSRGISFYLTVIVIAFFVLMSGAEASVVRAAIMGIILLLSKEAEQLFSVRNAIGVAAFLMVIVNPKVLVFDVGFQLSFFALLGIVYILPVLKKIFPYKSPGILRWKENSLMALSAQLAVVPLLLAVFGGFSVLALISNVLIAEAIPITMGLGFLMAGLGFISGFLGQTAALAVYPFLAFELWVIDLFSRFSLPITAESFGISAAAIYYLLLIGVIFSLNRKF